MSLNVLDLFSGIGGFSLGFEINGWSTVAFCEIDQNCHKILNKHWPNVTIFEDVSKFTKDVFHKLVPQKIDVICGGFPCQDISVAGKKAGITGSRSGLWKEFARLINEFKPKYAIIENVANLRSCGLATVLKDLWQIGYDAEWHCIPASALGAPHQRDRIWIIAYPDRKRRQCKESPPARKNDPQGWKECPAHPITGRNNYATERFSLPEAGFEESTERQKLYNSKTILADSYCSREMVERRSDKPAESKSDFRRNHKGRSRKNDYRSNQSQENEKLANTLCTGLAGQSRNSGETGERRQILQHWQVSLFRCTRGIELWSEEPSITRLAENGLNPNWVEWLMGFPVGWTYGLSGKHRLKALGNSVVPVIPEMISYAINKLSNHG